MKRLLHSLALGWICAIVVVAPVSGADREHQQMMADIRMLQEQGMRLNLMLGTLDTTLQTLLTRLDEQDDASRRAFADQKLAVDNVAGQVRIVREKIDETNVRVSSLAQEVESVRVGMTKLRAPRLTHLAVDPETGLPTAATGVGVQASVPVAPIDPGISPQRMYQQAWGDYATGQWALSIQGFEAYLSAFPRSELSDDAQFFIGDNHYANGQFQEALAAYEQVITGYPDGDKVAEALYKRGLTLGRLNEPELARQAFEQVVRNHPDDNMANLAQQALDRIER
ncbi:MAG: tol-pal system protein YbgF [Acidobacteria bacterium]|nr:tol-pal system protein YbgF [Acidobacteriota bacterium]